MLHKDSISVKEFVDIHNEKIKNKISKKNLAANLRQIVKMEDVTLNLEKDPNIKLTLPCVVGEIDFGNLIFDCNLVYNLIDIKEYQNENKDAEIYNRPEIYDYFNFYCKSERLGDKSDDFTIAPHIDYGHPCLGEFINNFVAHFIIHDYAAVANTLKDYIKSMNRDSHYYYDAVSTHVIQCYRCEDIIKPIIYKHTLTDEEKKKNYYCSHCKDLK